MKYSKSIALWSNVQLSLLLLNSVVELDWSHKIVVIFSQLSKIWEEGSSQDLGLLATLQKLWKRDRECIAIGQIFCSL